MTLLESIGAAVKAMTVSRSQSVVAGTYIRGGSASGSWQGQEIRYTKAVNEGYKRLVWVYNCIQKLSTSVASVSWKVYEKGGGDTKRPLPGHPLEILLKRPNPNCDGKEFMTGLMIDLSLGGEAFWEKVFATDNQRKPVPRWLYRLRPDWVTPLPDAATYLKGFEFDPGGMTKKIPYEPSEIIWFKYIDPLNEYEGLAPITAAARTIDSENSVITWNQSLLDNAAVPGGNLTIPPTATTDKETRARLREELKENFSGSNAHMPLVLWGGMTWEQMGLDAEEISFIEQRKLNKYEICAIFEVPPQLVGAEVDAKFNNYFVARGVFWEERIVPLLNWIRTKINNEIAPYFGPNIIADYDLSDIPAMREIFDQKIASGQKLFAMGVPLNTVIEKLALNLEPLPWGSVWWAPANLIPVGSAEPPEPPEEEPDMPPVDDDEDEVAPPELPDA